MYEIKIQGSTIDEIDKKIFDLAQIHVDARWKRLMDEQTPLNQEQIAAFSKATGDDNGSLIHQVPPAEKVLPPQAFDQVAESPAALTIDKPAMKPATFATGDADARGVKWDERIHASSKGRNTDGSWRARRGVDANVVAKIESEQAVSPNLNSAQSFVPPVPSSVPTAPVAVDPLPIAQPVAVAAVPFVPVAPVAGGHTLQTFQANLPVVLSTLMNEKKIDQSYIKTLCDHFKVGQIFEIFGDHQKVSDLFDTFVEAGLVVKVG